MILWKTAHPKVFHTLMHPNTCPMGPLLLGGWSVGKMLGEGGIDHLPMLVSIEGSLSVLLDRKLTRRFLAGIGQNSNFNLLMVARRPV